MMANARSEALGKSKRVSSASKRRYVYFIDRAPFQVNSSYHAGAKMAITNRTPPPYHGTRGRVE
jgi:hypothetical protein